MSFISPVSYCDPADWIEGNINLDYDRTAARGGMVDLSLTPHLIDPIGFWGRQSESFMAMTIMAVEQTGKSCCWLWPLLWYMVNNPGPSLMIHKSDEDAKDFNQDRFEPLMRGISKLRLELERPWAKRRDCFKFSNMRLYFQGGGSDIVSKTMSLTIADEPESWPKESSKVIKDFEDMEKRSRTYAGKRVSVCSPRYEDGPISLDFNKSSQGFRYLRCLKCEKLTMRTCDIHNMQWELDRKKTLIPESIILVCPKCGRRHIESERLEMNRGGAYIHRFPELLGRHEGYQWGALVATYQPGMSWAMIAEKQLSAGRSANVQMQRSFDNSIRGLPFKPRPANLGQINQIRSHCSDPPDPDRIENIFLVADTQLKVWKYTIWAVLANGNFHLLEFGETEYLELTDADRERIDREREKEAADTDGIAEPVWTLDDVWNEKYLDIQPVMGIIDEGGHREREVAPYVQARPGMFSYKGDNRACVSDKWKYSENKESLILFREKDYSSDFLYYLYTQDNRGNNYLELPKDASDLLINELAAMRQNEKVHNGHMYENYSHEGRVHDYFDCGKMFLGLLDVAKSELAAKYWRVGELDGIAKLSKKKPERLKESRSWMTGYTLGKPS